MQHGTIGPCARRVCDLIYHSAGQKWWKKERITVRRCIIGDKYKDDE